MSPGVPAVLVLAALSGCALLGKSDPVKARYFTPEYEGGAAAARSDRLLRLGRVEAWSHLRERMVLRSSARELLYYEDRRWIERPEIYLRRALARTLFEERGLVEALSGRAVTLEVELISFEEIEQPHEVRMQARLVIWNERAALVAETITVEQPVAQPLALGAEADPARSVADAFSLALRAGVNRIADLVVAKLAEQPPNAAK